jgi:hypothetical protein
MCCREIALFLPDTTKILGNVFSLSLSISLFNPTLSVFFFQSFPYLKKKKFNGVVFSSIKLDISYLINFFYCFYFFNIIVVFILMVPLDWPSFDINKKFGWIFF